MKRVMLASAVWLLAASAASAQTVYIVRHAEKADASADPELSPAGQERAEALAAALREAHPSLVLTSPLKRTRLTAGPTADYHSAPVEVVSLAGGGAAHVEAAAARVRALPADAAVLIVGHSNTVPLIARALGGEATDMDECEYDRLIVLRLDGAQTQSVVRRYGAPSACPQD
jgi:broad specificity phosphatase PhoE